MHEIESAFFDFGKCAVEIVSVELSLADRVQPDREERLAVDKRHTIIT